MTVFGTFLLAVPSELILSNTIVENDDGYHGLAQEGGMETCQHAWMRFARCAGGMLRQEEMGWYKLRHGRVKKSRGKRGRTDARIDIERAFMGNGNGYYSRSHWLHVARGRKMLQRWRISY